MATPATHLPRPAQQQARKHVLMFSRPRTMLRPTLWVSEPDSAADAAPATYRMTCDACGAKSHTRVEFGTAQDWQLHHAAQLHHLAYTQTITRPWRARMKDPPPQPSGHRWAQRP
ncbi:hypothetical protein PJ985_08935 [Streptomyces sp. ACA25]|uniref:DUF7848 domain-containing protein n=1 Tax=Streptomyces sp. ACA25 TaxID=3022596 RepID=UPI0023081387|nr:hypothetical protein [Streptomyces sp. ACA25]MDB1087691.1 hypothetical protein [Streptomyces sp. ACA25]